MLIGHIATIQSISQLLAAGKLPHALMLTGPKGIGKATLATHLAHRLICGADSKFQMPDTSNPFATNTQSPQYAQLQASSCPDFHLLTVPEKKKSIGVEDVRTLLTTLKRTADTQRVIIVDSVDAMTPEAANTLLKTLEEPRPGITFLLIAHSLAQVLPTIRSRCRLMRLSPLSQNETAEVLKHLGEDPAKAATAHGCPGQVLMAEDPLQTLLIQLAKQQSFAASQTYTTITQLAQTAKALNLPAADVLAHAKNISAAPLSQSPSHPKS